MRKYNDYRVANGLTLGTFVWFPSYGDGNADFEFKFKSERPLGGTNKIDRRIL